MKIDYTRWVGVAAALCLPTILFAQFTVTGTVVDADEVPLIGVSVLVQGTGAGTVTDLDGRFEVLIPADEGTLLVSYVGYESVELPVTSAAPELEVIVLAEGAALLDEVVVTGLASSVKRSNLANSVAQIQAKELTGLTSQTTIDGALYGKFKGADIRASSGAPGGGISLRLRGVTSIFGDQQPLFIVDGVYVNNSTVSLGTNIVTEAAGGGNAATNQDGASNRIADIDPEDIESIEILKGASAAAIYGSRAAGGVVLIKTKRGRAGQAEVTFAQDIGFARPLRLLGPRGFTEETAAATVSDSAGSVFAAEAVRAGRLNDYEKLLFDNTPLLSTSRLEVSGGTEKTNFFAGATYKNEGGLVDKTGYEKSSVRVNIGHRFNDKLDFYVSNNYINSSNDRGLFNNSNNNTTAGYALAFTKPWESLFPDEDGTYPDGDAGSNVLETIDRITNREEVQRYIGGLNVNWNVYQTDRNTVKVAFQGGVDQYTLRTTSIFPSSLTYYSDPGSLGGVSISGSTVNSDFNLTGTLVYTHYTPSGVSLRSQMGASQLRFDQNTVVSTATGLNGSQTNVDQSSNTALSQNQIPQLDRGAFFQEEINFNDKVFLTAGIRGDKSSNNGDPNKLFFFPKAAVAINIHEFTDLSGASVSSLKLRGAFGQAGRFANFNDRFNPLGGIVIDGQSGFVSSGQLGNLGVVPERQSELEAGIDLGILNNRVLIDITGYIKDIDDLLLSEQVPASSGYTSRVVNGGSLVNRGVEIGVNADAVHTEDFVWTTSVNFWLNRSEVTELSVPAFNTGGFAASLGQFRIEEGQPATQIVGTYATSTAYDSTGLSPDEIGAIDPNRDGRINLTDEELAAIDPDGDGFAVIGNAEADFNLSTVNTFSYKAFEFSFVAHWRKGGDNINLSTLLYDLANNTWDYDDVTLDPLGLLGNGDYRKTERNAGNASPWVEDAGYFRVREMSLHYTLGREKLGGVASLRFGVSGRNLINVFDYNSYDPEVSNFGNNVLANNVEVTPYPSTKRFMFHVRANF